MRFVLRLLSLLSLVLAVIAGTIDSIQSVAASSVVLTSFGSAWQDMSAGTLTAARAFVEKHLGQKSWDAVFGWLLFQPAFAVLLAFSLLLWVVAYKRRNPLGPFAA